MFSTILDSDHDEIDLIYVCEITLAREERLDWDSPLLGIILFNVKFQ